MKRARGVAPACALRANDASSYNHTSGSAP